MHEGKGFGGLGVVAGFELGHYKDRDPDRDPDRDRLVSGVSIWPVPTTRYSAA